MASTVLNFTIKQVLWFYFFKKRQKSTKFSYFCAAFKPDSFQKRNEPLI